MTKHRMPKIDFSRYHGYQEMSEIMADLVRNWPKLARISSIGKSLQDRDLWLLEITNSETGTGDQKPGYFIDGNTHPEELAGAAAALHIAWYLLTRYGDDETVTRLLDRRTFYILPRLNPDGAEICLTEPFYQWIGNQRYAPGEEQLSHDGLHYQDINGDGEILDMRWRDPLGEWKVSEKDPRIMLQREPDEFGGDYYRLVPEGMIWNFDGGEIPIPRPMDGNLNRNYPGYWGTESEQYGAGEYPMSEPEVEAVVKFVKDHPNIFGALSYHTNAGAILPPTHIKGQPLPLKDADIFKHIAELGTEETGYPIIFDEADFNFPGHTHRLGTSDDFLYGQLGIICFVVELWDVFAAAGIEKEWLFPLREFSEDENLKLLRWSDEQLNGEGFMEWTPFDHPQLGKIEIGGWRRLFMFRNPPGHRLEEMCLKNTMFALRHAAAAPEIHLGHTEAESLGDGLTRISAVVENWGYLSTNVTEQATNMEAIGPVSARIELGEGLELVSGREEVYLGHLAGRSDRRRHYSRFFTWKPARRKVEWVIRRTQQDASSSVSVLANSQRGGVDTKIIQISN